MADPSVAPLQTRTIRFTRNADLIKNGATAAIDVTVADPRLLAEPFPHKTIDLSAIRATVQGGQDLTFLSNGGAEVNFRASAGASAGAGVFPDGESIQGALQLDGHISLDMPADPAKHYTLLRCGFDFNASVNGSVALGAGGAVSLGLEASADAKYAVIRRFVDNAAIGFEELAGVANSWKLPVHVKSDADLDTGTWIVAEIGGSIAVQLGAQYGLDYNWIRQLKAGGLGGDIALRLHLGINAALGLSASGTYLVVVSRDSLTPGDRVVRLRLFRRSQRGWSFALNAGAAFRLDTSQFLPGQVDDFIKAVFGVHGAQVISDLQLVEKWTGSDATLGGLLAAAGAGRVKKLLKDVTGIDPETAFNQAKSRFTKFFSAWNELPNTVSSLVLKLLDEQADLTDVRKLANLIASGNQDLFNTFLASRLGDVAFFRTPAGRYLESLTAQGLVSLLDKPAFMAAKQVAASTLAVLDGGEIESVLTKLQAGIVTALNLQPLANLAGRIDQTTFDSLDSLLKAKLAAFVDKKVQELGLEDVEKIRVALGKMIGRRQEFYQKALDALNHDYKFNFAASYQSVTARGALIDVSFDFARGDTGGLSGLLRDAIAGRLDKLLISSVTGVSLKTARLTHELKRQSHCEFNMPYFSASADELLTSDASVMPVEADNGRLLAYDLRARDQVTARIETRLKRSSTLAVGAALKTPAGAEPRIFGSTLTYEYDFRQLAKGMKRADFERQTNAYIDLYFSSLFPAGGGTPAGWLKRLEQNAAAGETLGNAILTVNLSVPTDVAAAWLSPADANEQLRVARMKGALLQALRRLIPFYFFSDLTRFNETGFASASLLVYQASSPGLGQLDHLTDREVITAIVEETVVGGDASPLGRVLNFWSARLNAANHPRKEFFQNNGTNRQQIRSLAESANNMQNLLFGDAEVLAGAGKARRDIVTFLQSGSGKPSEALEALARFGADLVSTFNQRITSIYGGGALRPLGTLAFLEAAHALANVSISANAMLDVTVLKPSVDPLAFADSDPAPDQIVVDERLVAVGVAPALPPG